MRTWCDKKLCAKDKDSNLRNRPRPENKFSSTYVVVTDLGDSVYILVTPKSICSINVTDLRSVPSFLILHSPTDYKDYRKISTCGVKYLMDPVSAQTESKIRRVYENITEL